MAPNDAISVQLRLRDVAERARQASPPRASMASRSPPVSEVHLLSHSETDDCTRLIAAADDARRRARQRGKGEVEIG